MAFEGTVTLLSETLPAEVARQMLHDLNGLEKYDCAADLVDHSERFSFRRLRDRDQSRRTRSEGCSTPTEKPETSSIICTASTSIGTPCYAKAIEFYDGYVAALKLKDPTARQAALARVQNDLEAAVTRPDAGTYLAAVINPSARCRYGCVAPHGHAPAGTLRSSMPRRPAPMYSSSWPASAPLSRCLTLSMALIRQSWRNSCRPCSTNFLPTTTATRPSFTSGPPMATCSTAGANLIDDHASNERFTIFEGIRLEALEENASAPLREKIPQGSDDISIRIPRVPPKAPASKPLPAQ